MSVEELEAAVMRLSAEDRSRFLVWVETTCAADGVFVGVLGHGLSARRRGEVLAGPFGAWSANIVDFDALRAEADHR